MTQWSLSPVTSVVVILGVCTVLAGLLVITARQHWIPTPRRRVLIAFRAMAVLLLATMMLRPGCIQTVSQPQRATIAVTVDVSRSMQLPHVAGGESRWERLRSLLKETSPQWQELENKFDIKVFEFDRELRPIEYDDGEFSLPDVPAGGQTDQGVALDSLAQQLRGDRVAAILFAGDGVQNVEFPPIEMPRALREIEQLQAPLLTLPFGRKGQDDASVDIAVANLPDQFAVFVKNELLVRAMLRTRGFANQALPVELVLVEPDGTERVVGTQTVTPTQPVDEVQVDFRYSPQDPGEYRLIVRAEPQMREVVDRNNELTAFLTVHEGGLRVLYIEGRLDLEQRYLRRSLALSQDLEVDFLWIDHRDRSRWPLNLTEQFRDPNYDVIILGDLDSRSLQVSGGDTGSLGVLADVVQQGRGLILLGGRHSFGPGRYQTTPLADVMPVVMHDYEAQDFDAPLNSALHLERELSLQPTQEHFLTRLSGDEGTSQWSSLPPLLGANRFSEVKRDARVLLETERGEPMLVAGNPGGRVIAFAGDSTWRWWTMGHSEAHRRFWRQMVLWAAGLDSLGQDAIVIDMARRRFNQGSPVEAAVGARTAAGDPLDDARIEATLVGPDGSRSTVRVPSRGVSRMLEIEADALVRPGLYRLEVEAWNGDSSIGRRGVEFVVFDDDREKAIADADPDQLARFSASTKEFGGELVVPEQLSEALQRLIDAPPELETFVPRRWRLGDSFPDAALLLLGMTVLLGAEWWLRRRWGLA
ncbi:MAG: hypothetical protein KDA83_12690 [Planctomycetales bacterium]|nr:hypothetical protein [Planctomycetales bacterium]